MSLILDYIVDASIISEINSYLIEFLKPPMILKTASRKTIK